MADINLNVPIHDINVAVAVPAFLAYKPMTTHMEGEIEVDDFATVKKHVEHESSEFVKRCVNRGIDILKAKEGQKHLTEL